MVRTSSQSLLITTLADSIKHDVTGLAMDMLLLEETSTEDEADPTLQDEKDNITSAKIQSIQLKSRALLAIQAN
ncbi:hypothetical protein PGT21_028821 [Puccinia graminis f. sp. tritici]|uniref:Uncharacterized protein n=1 Tax=Puccinia graminis f. sp. tritici TaxID=56615 RepID=A0A5B0QNV7_PUCGR|nr:hypothetical protein PGT21_028821 [Puccinia graminis f. sp. tritici]